MRSKRNVAASELGSPQEIEITESRKSLKPSQCRSFMRQRLAEAFPRIVQGFVQEATTGSCARVKLASELLDHPPRKLAAKKGSAQKLLEKLGREPPPLS